MSKPVNFAVIGAGGFARFSVSQLVKQNGAHLAGVYDNNPDSIAQLKQTHHSVTVFDNLDQLLNDPSIDLVYIASPPYLHYEQSLAALRAGKHVICEKPAAIELRHAHELRRLAEAKNLLFVVNLMQRYNPLYAAVKSLIDAELLGSFLHGFFENYASDEFLPTGHWFWDDSKSGGIFIEHGVHFFDMFSGWLGQGRVVAAQRLSRPGFPAVRDIAQCTVLYEESAPVHFYHGFNQPKILDRQEMRLQFERGEITLFEWVPTRLVLNAVCAQAEVEALKHLFPGATLDPVETWDTPQAAQGRFKPVRFNQKIRLDTGETQTKTEVYEGLVRGMFDDQTRWLADRTWQRKIDAANAVESLAMAARAEEMAQSA